MLAKAALVFGSSFAILLLGVLSNVDSTAQQPKSQKLQTVDAAELGKTAQILGRLGKPMTEVVEIEGHWVDRGLFTKASRYVLVVTSAASKQLDPPVEFNLYVVSWGGKGMTDKDFNVKEKWKCKAIELGRFRNVVESNWELFYDASVVPPSWGAGPFVSELVVSQKSLVRTEGK